MSSPTVSVIMATYNHANFVAEAIQSVLKQKGVDFEFLISDDGSSDTTREVVGAIKDDRIRFFPNEVNRGACVVTNELIGRARGEFISLLNSDDYWIGADKLAFQLQFMRENPHVAACFGRAKFIDKNGFEIHKSSLPHGAVFDQFNRSKGAWLRHFFDKGNCICHPTVFIRKKCYEELGGYDNRLRQLPDFDMWLRLIKRYDIHISDRELVAFRHLPGENASSSTPANTRRLLNESYFVLRTFFDGVDLVDFHDGFGDVLTKHASLTKNIMEIEQSFLFLSKNRWAAHVYNQVGIERLYCQLLNPDFRDLLVNIYSFDDRSFQAVVSENCVFDLDSPAGKITHLSGDFLLKELKRRIVARAPKIIQPLLGKLFF